MQEVPRIDVTDSYRTLGVYLSPSGAQQQQAKFYALSPTITSLRCQPLHSLQRKPTLLTCYTLDPNLPTQCHARH
jgi:hypothetical protein